MRSRDDPDWISDLFRVGSKRAMLKEQSLWAIWTYRFGRRVVNLPQGLKRRILLRLYWVLFRLTETIFGISLPISAEIGPGLRIWHFGGIFVHERARIGSNCTLRQGVTIGNRRDEDRAPVLGDYVEIGAYAQILGPIRIGNRCRIGAHAVLLADMPDDSTAVGPSARIITRSDESP
jgi:serine O-acetyltransferase